MKKNLIFACLISLCLTARAQTNYITRTNNTGTLQNIIPTTSAFWRGELKLETAQLFFADTNVINGLLANTYFINSLAGALSTNSALVTALSTNVAFLTAIATNATFITALSTNIGFSTNLTHVWKTLSAPTNSLVLNDSMLWRIAVTNQNVLITNLTGSGTSSLLMVQNNGGTGATLTLVPGRAGINSTNVILIPAGKQGIVSYLTDNLALTNYVDTLFQ